MAWKISHYVNFNKPYKNVSHLEDVLLVPGGNAGHVWAVTVEDGGAPADLSGYTAEARFQRFPDGNQFVIDGSVDGNAAQVTFNSLVYAVPGLLRGVFFLISGAVEIPVIEAYFDVRDNFTGDVSLSEDQIVYYPESGRIAYNGDDYFDISDTTAVQTDVRDGKVFYLADGTQATGDASFDVTASGLTVTAQLVEGDDYEIIVS